MKLYSMKKLVLSLIAIFMLIGSSSTLNATHIVGGDMTYRCLGNGEYEITLTLRRDCYNGDDDALFDDPALIGIFRHDGSLMTGFGDKASGVINIPLSYSDTLNETITSECGFIGEQVCVETTTYRKNVTLPFLEQGYTLAYQRCCRNITLNNIIDPLETGSAYYVDITDLAQLECNNSPTFNDWAAVYICKDTELVFDQSATDIDGDSLVYSLCIPHSSLTIDNPIINSTSDLINFAPPFDEVAWSSPYSLTDLMGGTALAIDPLTGLMTANPNLVGQFLIGVCVEEFRNGVSIGKTIRDFEYNVRVCSAAPEIDFSYEDIECGELEVDFTNLSVGADTYEWFFEYPNTTITSTDTNPSHIYPGEGIYEIVLIGKRETDGCEVEKSKIIEIPGENVEPAFEVSITNCSDDESTLHLVDTSVSSGTYDRNWTVTQGSDLSVSIDEEWDVILMNEDDITVQLIVGKGPCLDTLEKVFTLASLKPSIDVDYQILDCIGDSLVIKVNATFTTPLGTTLTSNEWEIYTGFSGEQFLTDTTMATMTILNIDEMEVNIVAIADNGCDITYTETFDPDYVLIELVVDDPYILCLGDSTRLIANPHSNWTYTWNPTEGLIFDPMTDHSNPWAKPTETTIYNVTVTDGVCTKDTTITVVVMDGSEFEIVGETQLCDTDEVKLWVEGNSVGNVEFEWSTDPDFNSIIHTGDTLNTIIVGSTGIYYARIKDGLVCNEEVKSITVNREEKPILDFTFETECGSYKVCFKSTSGLSDDKTSWDFGDLSVVTDVDTGNEVCYTYPTAGNYDVTLSDLTTDCPGDSITKTITVFEFPDISVDLDNYEVCEGESVIINVTTNTENGAISYCDENGVELSVENPWEVEFSENIVITAKVTDENGCVVTQEITVVINEFESSNIELEITPEETGYAGSKYTLEVTGGIEGFVYEWSSGETSSSIEVAPLETTTYCVTVTDNNGCVEELCQTISIEVPVLCNEEDVYIPTAFSPNGDDVNDVFMVRSNVMTSIDMIVYDRWGEQIFATKTLGTGWNGTFKGAELSPDVYAYCVRGVCVNGDEILRVGNVSLLK